jgi:NAD(P) transhydrogenase subunit alpha
MGAEFVQVELEEDGEGLGGYAKEMSPAFIAAEMELIRQQAREVDIIITTALIPGKPAPLLITEEAVELMRRGSVIVDLAAETGGNCAVTQPGKVIEHKGVTVIGYSDLPSRLAPTASQLYGNNLLHLLADMGGAKTWHIDEADQVVRGALVLLNGEKKWPPPKIEAPPAPAVRKSIPAPSSVSEAKAKPKEQHAFRTVAFVAAAALGLLGLGLVAPREFLAHFTVFVLAVFVGWQLVWNVTPALHTPLMSVTNAISGIIIVGGLLQVSGPLDSPVTLLGAVAVLLATINVAGGFLVTQRMLKMFRR